MYCEHLIYTKHHKILVFIFEGSSSYTSFALESCLLYFIHSYYSDAGIMLSLATKLTVLSCMFLPHLLVFIFDVLRQN